MSQFGRTNDSLLGVDVENNDNLNVTIKSGTGLSSLNASRDFGVPRGLAGVNVSQSVGSTTSDTQNQAEKTRAVLDRVKKFIGTRKEDRNARADSKSVTTDNIGGRDSGSKLASIAGAFAKTTGP